MLFWNLTENSKDIMKVIGSFVLPLPQLTNQLAGPEAVLTAVHGVYIVNALS